MARHRYFSILLILAVSAVFLINWLIPFFADDYGWAFIFNNPHKVATLSDIFISQFNYYQTWGGRNVAHAMLQLLLMENSQLVLALVKTIWLILIIGVICLLAYANNYKQRLSPRVVFIIFAAFWVFHPCLGECTFWITGACNYLFAPLLALTFLLPFRFLVDDYITQNTSHRLKLGIRVLLISAWLGLALFAGWSNENMVIGIWLLIAVFFWFSYTQKRKIPWYIYIGIALFTLGAVILLLAPGNHLRCLADWQWTHVPKSIIFIKHFGDFLRNEVFEILIFISFAYLYSKTKPIKLKRLALLIFACGIFIDFIMIFSPQMPWRTFASGFFLKFIAIVALFEEKYLLNSRFKKVMLLLSLVFILSIIHALIAYFTMYRINQQRLAILTQVKVTQQEAFLPLYPSFLIKCGAVFKSDIHTDKQFWINKSLAHYYGLQQGVAGYKPN